MAQNGLAKIGLAKIELTKIGQIKMAKTGLAKVGPFRRNVTPSWLHHPATSNAITRR